MATIVYRETKGSPLTNAEVDANLTNINAETVDNSAVFNLRPSLDVDIVGSKTLSPLATFSRASTGTYYDTNGVIKTAPVNTPRFNHDPVTGEFKGMLVEDSRTNLLTYSEQFDNGAWSVYNCSITPDTVISPDGTLTADTFVYGAIAAGVYRTVSQTGTYTASVYGKFNTLKWLSLSSVYTTPAASAFFDLQTGTVGNTAGCTANITSVGNGWYRCSITYTTTSAASARFSVYGTDTNGGNSGVAGTSFYIWGAQLEAGSTLTSYIPTTSAAVTRQADQLSISKATTSWFNSTSGTLALAHDAASGQPLLGDGATTILSSLGAGTINIDYSNSQLPVVTQSGQTTATQGIFNFDSDLQILGNSTTKANARIKYMKFYPNNVIGSTPEGSGFILDDGYAMLQEDGSVLFQE